MTLNLAITVFFLGGNCNNSVKVKYVFTSFLWGNFNNCITSNLHLQAFSFGTTVAKCVILTFALISFSVGQLQQLCDCEICIYRFSGGQL